MPTLTGHSRPPASGGAPKQLVILLHGWGADGANLIDLADAMADALPDAHFIAPDAPSVCEVNPYGFEWFPLTDRDPAVLFSGAQRAAGVLNTYLDDQLRALALPDAKLALLGFSQGTMTALHVALRRPAPVGCVVGFSGALLGAEQLAQDVVSRPPVCLLHGQMDDVVPFAAMAHARAALSAAGLAVETHPRPSLGHSIDMEGINVAKRFIAKHLGA